jgi:hypothetical protein
MKIEITNREESMTIGVANFRATPGDKPEALAPGDRRTFEVANENDFLIIGELEAAIAVRSRWLMKMANADMAQPDAAPVEHEQPDAAPVEQPTTPATGEE